MASSYDDWEAEYTGCERCGDDHGDGLTCREVERVEEEMREEEWEWEQDWEGPALPRRRAAPPPAPIVRVGDRVYYVEDTRKQLRSGGQGSRLRLLLRLTGRRSTDTRSNML